MYGECANCPFIATQAITKCYHILNNCGKIYNDYLRSWNRIQENQKTWNRFKMHFSQAYNELEATNALSIGDLGFGSANLMDEVVDRLSAESLLRAKYTSDNVPIQSTPVANATDRNLLQELFDQNRELIRCLTEINNKSQDRPRQSAPGPKQGQPIKPLPPRYNKYCWTHGRCNHQGSDCRNKAPGHKDDASMLDKMGGSTYACPSS